MPTDEEMQELEAVRELSRQLRGMRQRRRAQIARTPFGPDEQLQRENPFFSPREVRGEWRATNQ